MWYYSSESGIVKVILVLRRHPWQNTCVDILETILRMTGTCDKILADEVILEIMVKYWHWHMVTLGMKGTYEKML